MKTEAQIKRRIEQLEAKIPRLEKIAYAPQVIPGPHAVGRANYSMGKKLDAENNRRADAFAQCEAAKKELAFWETRLSNVQAGETHLNGQPRKDAPSRQKAKSLEAQIDAFMRAHIKAGDAVGIAANPANSLSVKRVNQKTITDAMGEKWKFAEILLWKDGKSMSLAELVPMVTAWIKEQEGN
jgi:hypothetical protein